MKVSKEIKTVNRIHVDGFYNWMNKIKNIHLADNQQMSKAFDRVLTTKS